MPRSSQHLRTASLLSFCLVLFALPGGHAERLCPGNAASITPRFVQHTLIVIPVKISGKGPFDFIVDTGSQITEVDTALATQLVLSHMGTTDVATVAGHVNAPLAEVAAIEADSHVVENALVAVQDLRQLQTVDPRIRGLLGESFLARFDVFIDYRRKIFCMDNTDQMRQTIRGERISIVEQHDSEADPPFPLQLIISVQLSDAPGRRLFLRLDSGTNAPMLFVKTHETPEWMTSRPSQKVRLAGTAEQDFEILPPQDLTIGNRTLRHIAFIKPVDNGSNYLKNEQDGLLPTGLFHRVFISFADRWVAFNPE